MKLKDLKPAYKALAIAEYFNYIKKENFDMKNLNQQQTLKNVTEKENQSIRVQSMFSFKESIFGLYFWSEIVYKEGNPEIDSSKLLELQKKTTYEKIQIKRYDEIVIGDQLEIIGVPSHYSSKFNNNDPRRNVIEYPYSFTVINNDGVSMTCGKYGWYIDSCIEVGLFKIQKTNNT